MNNTALQTIVTKSLPALSGESFTYNPARNMFVTPGYTSAGGNTYFKAIRFSDRLIVYYDLSLGYKYTFLNGIKLFCFDGQKSSIIAQKCWNGDDWKVFTEQFAKDQSVLMLCNYLLGQLKAQGAYVSNQEIFSYAYNMIEETQRKQLA
jgi:hypothetical protein